MNGTIAEVAEVKRGTNKKGEWILSKVKTTEDVLFSTFDKSVIGGEGKSFSADVVKNENGYNEAKKVAITETKEVEQEEEKAAPTIKDLLKPKESRTTRIVALNASVLYLGAVATHLKGMGDLPNWGKVAEDMERWLKEEKE